MRFPFFTLVCLGLLTACQSSPPTLFTALDPADTHLSFVNTITERPEQNVMTYEYHYNGGGVAAGDLNNDGLVDLYFTGNQVSDKLYLNRTKPSESSSSGAITFEDVTEPAGVAAPDSASTSGAPKLGASTPGWKTGVTMADVNGDGWLDLYVCRSALPAVADRTNRLFINNGGQPGSVPTFTERAAEYGLDAPGSFSTQATFFDYDRDGDLDMFLVNHGNMFYTPFFNTTKLRTTRHPYFGNRLFRNDGARFTDVSDQAGIHGGGLNFGLSTTVSDLTGDGWPDLYVANDYEEQDYLYINQQNGTFAERTKQAFTHLSRNTMGTDAADLDNDERPDLLTLDMLPEHYDRQKLLKGPDQHDRFQLMVDSGFHYQYMRNMLHLNTGTDATGTPQFSEVGQLTGLSNTDWSWAALLADYDGDGRKDIFITNGIVRDFTSLDFLKYDMEEARQRAFAVGKDLSTEAATKQNLPTRELIAKLPATKTDNYAFRNRGSDQPFENVTQAWGLKEGAVSTGAAYADLDNDGDLDLIVCNTNEPATIYRNNAETLTKPHYLKLKADGQGANRFGVGARVVVEQTGQRQMQELMPGRGFQSSVEPALLFGFGQNSRPVSLTVMWPDGRVATVGNVNVDQTLTLRQADARKQTTESTATPASVPKPGLFRFVTDGIPFVHRENAYVDVKREPLIPYQLSRQGPALAAADVDGDGYDDVFVGGAAGQSGRLFLQKAGGAFVESPSQPWEADAGSEDISAVFFDADGDKDADLYVVSGGHEFTPGSPALQDRLYVNNGPRGRGMFTKAELGTLPVETAPGSCVAAGDYDRDGDLDLFVGGRTQERQFPLAAPSYLLRNESAGGRVRFVNSTPSDLFQPGQSRLGQSRPGMTTDATWTDVNRDGWLDLLIVGDWMPVTLFLNQRGKLTKAPAEAAGLARTGGLWTRIMPQDLDRDGDLDFVLGNLGTNVQWKATEADPLTLVSADFNEDGRVDPIVCVSQSGRLVPTASRDEMLDQINTLRPRFVRYADYAKTDLQTMLGTDALTKAVQQPVHTLQSSWLENKGGAQPTFALHPLPLAAQVSAVQVILPGDYTGNGQRGLLLAGNFFPMRVEQGRCDAGRGLILTNQSGKFRPVNASTTGLAITGDVRRGVELRSPESGRTFVFAVNNGPVQVWRWRESPGQ